MESTYEDYSKRPGLTATTLRQFVHGPEKVDKPFPLKTYFSHGHLFEELIEDYTQGTKNIDNYAIAEINSSMPVDLPQWINDGALDDQYARNKDGSLSKKCHAKHAWLDFAKTIADSGKTIIKQIDFLTIKKSVESALKIETNGICIRQVLSNKYCKFQVPIEWESDGIKKKMLADAIYHNPENGFTILYDFKLYASIDAFKKYLRYDYGWIQASHYEEGALSEYGTPVRMQFIVGSKDKSEDYLACSIKISQQVCAVLDQEYMLKCEKFAKWDADGRLLKGYMDELEVTPFII